jgi:hypothetical protein
MTWKGGGGLTGTANRKRVPFGATPHAGSTPGSVNSRFAAPGRNSRVVPTSIAITDPSGAR